MDAFEEVVGEVLWREGFWVRTSVKIELTKEDKAAIKRPTSPRWELDVVAYRPKDNLIWVVECKSFLNSRGVGAKWLTGIDARSAGYYKMFTEPTLRTVVFDRLKDQFIEAGICRQNPKIQLCLACGKIRPGALEPLTEHFAENGWKLLDPEWLRGKLSEMADGRYENQVSAVVAKLILRGVAE